MGLHVPRLQYPLEVPPYLVLIDLGRRVGGGLVGVDVHKDLLFLLDVVESVQVVFHESPHHGRTVELVHEATADCHLRPLLRLRDGLEVGGNLVLGGCAELVLDDAQQPFVELQQRVYLVLVGLSHFLQLL